MSLASKALVAASTTLVATAQAIADNQPAPGGDPSTSDTPETTQDVTTAAANTGLSHDGEFRLADKITLRTSGAGGLEILKAGDPTPIQISDVELALMIDERYFARVDKGL